MIAATSTKPRSLVRSRLEDLIDRKNSMIVDCLNAYRVRVIGNFVSVDAELRQTARDPLVREDADVVRASADDGGIGEVPDDGLGVVVLVERVENQGGVALDVVFERVGVIRRGRILD